MSKVQKITVSNLKAISNQTGDFNGCTVLVTGGNNIGKTTFLRGLFDRVRGIKPDQIVKAGEESGFAEAELTTGEKLRWEFKKDGKEKLIYITEKDIKTSLTGELRKKFCPDTFDVDRFLQDPPMAQKKTLQDLAGLDFTDIDKRYKLAYEERQAVNRSYNEAKIKFGAIPIPTKVEDVDVDMLLMDKEVIKKELNDLYLANKAINNQARADWNTANEAIRKDFDEYNKLQTDRYQAIMLIEKYRDQIWEIKEKHSVLKELVNLDAVDAHIATMPEAMPFQKYEPMPEPTYIEELPDRTKLDEIDAKIQEAYDTNRKAQVYKDWVKQHQALDTLRETAVTADESVTKIETERMDLIKSAKMPEGFTFTDDGIAYNGMPFTREQLSSSGIYIGALKLASLKIGEIRCLHFDASFLDKNSLAEIEAWATEQDLQLLIERPNFDGGQIEYQLLQS